jgi:two-component system phosphate regulon response regulator OmpR
MSEMVKVLVVDDEAELRGLLQRYLGDQGCQVRTEPHAETVAALLARERFDVLVLDLMMPGEDGLSLCRRLRHQGETIPILMLTARGDPVDRVVGLEMGADDYLAKPFHPRELLARIQALVRRQQVLGAHRGPAVDTVLRFGPYALNLDARSLTRDGQAVPLTTGEFQLLQALALNPRRPGARPADRTGPWPRTRCDRSRHRFPDHATAQTHRDAAFGAALHPDGVGRGLCLHPDGQRRPG